MYQLSDRCLQKMSDFRIKFTSVQFHDIIQKQIITIIIHRVCVLTVF